MTHRFTIWQESRVRMHEYKQKQVESVRNLFNAITAENTTKLRDYEIVDEKTVQAVVQRYTFHISNLLSQNY